MWAVEHYRTALHEYVERIYVVRIIKNNNIVRILFIHVDTDRSLG